MGNFKINVVPDFVNMAQTLVATGILFLFLRHFLFKPVSAYLEKRRKYIQEGVANREEADRQLEKMNQEYDEKILQAKKEASDIISTARSYGEDLKVKAVDESKLLAKEEYDRGMLKLENEKQKAMKEMNDEIVEIALFATEKVLAEKTSSQRDKEMVQALIKDLEKAHDK